MGMFNFLVLIEDILRLSTKRFQARREEKLLTNGSTASLFVGVTVITMRYPGWLLKKYKYSRGRYLKKSSKAAMCTIAVPTF